jgi:hypothetical protein
MRCFAVVSNRCRELSILFALCCGLCMLPAHADLTQGLYGYWPLNDTLVDASGHGHTLSSAGSGGAPVTNSQGRYAECLQFDNITAGPQVLTAGAIDIPNTSGTTIAAWINPSELRAGFSSYAPHVIANLFNTGDGAAVIQFRIRDSKLEVYYAYPASNNQSSFVVPTNTWTFVACTMAGTQVKIYANNQGPWTFNVTGQKAYNRLYWGSSAVSGGTWRGLAGKLDETRLYARALSATEIAALYQQTPPAYTYNYLTNAGFETGSPLPTNWTITANGGWALDTSVAHEGTRSLRVDLPSNATVVDTTTCLSLSMSGLAGKLVRFSGYMRVQGVTNRNNRSAAAITLTGTHLSETLGEFFATTADFTYFEKDVQVPADAGSVALQLAGNGNAGTVWFDDLWVSTRAEHRTTPVEALPPSSSIPWHTGTRYRVLGQLDAATWNGDPVWAKLDTARLLLRDGVRDPVDNASVRVFALHTDGTFTSQPCVLDSPLPTLAAHYPMDAVVRFRAVNGVRNYAIYFNSAGAAGAQMPATNLNLGAGEYLRYNGTVNNWLWGGWAGDLLSDVYDADGDGDYDLFMNAFDGGTFIARNVGTNQSPVFLPRARARAEENPTEPATSPYSIDWDHDGDLDRLTVLLNSTDYYVGGSANFRLQLNTGGSYGTAQTMCDTNGQPLVLALGSWVNVAVVDIDGDGVSDFLAGSANNSLALFLNHGLVGGVPTAEATCLPFIADDNGTYANNCASEDMALKAFPFDWDGDGDQDLLVTGWHNFVYYLENASTSGQVRFMPARKFNQQGGTLAQGGDEPSPCAVDWDNDGDLDLIMGGCTGNIMYVQNIGTRTNPQYAGGVYLNNDLGQLIRITPAEAGGTIQGPFESYWGYLSAVATDWDRDGDLDLVINDSLGRLSWIPNVGTRAQPVLSHTIVPFQDRTALTTGLYGHWKFDNSFNDASGNGLTLTSAGNGGTPTYSSSGRVNQCLSLNNVTSGVSQCLRRTGISIASTQGVTVSAWVKPETLGSGFGGTTPHTVVNLMGTDSVLNFRLRDGKIDIYHSQANRNYLSDETLTLNAWNHVAFTQDANAIRVYLNGRMIYHDTTPAGQAYNTLYVGSQDPTSARGIDGLLDEVRLYRRELTDNEILALYEAEGAGQAPVAVQARNLITPWRNRPGVKDFDADGQDEIVVLDTAGRLPIYKRDGTSTQGLTRWKFALTTNSQPLIVNNFQDSALGRTQLDVADWNGDGALDILIGQDWPMHQNLSTVFLLLNRSDNLHPTYLKEHMPARDGYFVEWNSHNGIQNGHSAHPVAVDYDNDGQMDLLIGAETGQINYYNHNYFVGAHYPQWTTSSFEKSTATTGTQQSSAAGRGNFGGWTTYQ